MINIGKFLTHISLIWKKEHASNSIYHFEFRCCLKDQVPFDSIIYLQKRAKDPKNKGVPIPYNVPKKDPIVAGTMMSNFSYYSTGSLTASLKLKAGDVVNLYSPSKRGYLFDIASHYSQFTGWLVEEDLVVAWTSSILMHFYELFSKIYFKFYF